MLVAVLGKSWDLALGRRLIGILSRRPAHFQAPAQAQDNDSTDPTDVPQTVTTPEVMVVQNDTEAL